MRSEQEILDLILEVAKADKNVRAVCLGGSRANPSVKKDDYQDYDITYLVRNVSIIAENKNFPKKFGQPLIVQEPLPENPEINYTCLMLFDDGTRIDLQVERLDNHYCIKDSLAMLLFDKDNIFQGIPVSSDRNYWIKKPTEIEYQQACNNFWWCLNNVVKGIKRQQLSYAIRMYMETSHRELEKLLDWQIASNYQFQMTTGMWGKNLSQYLLPEVYNLYTKTYPSGTGAELWKSLLISCDLFHDSAVYLSQKLNFVYHQSEEDGMRSYLKMMKKEKE